MFVKEPSEGEDGQEVECKYEILNLLEFDSTRKRMSVIVKDPAGKLLLLTKVRAATSLLRGCMRRTSTALAKGGGINFLRSIFFTSRVTVASLQYPFAFP